MIQLLIFYLITQISYININSTNEKNFFKFNKKNKIEKFSENYKLEIGRAIIENSKSNK